jgi:hypothetical protein
LGNSTAPPKNKNPSQASTDSEGQDVAKGDLVEGLLLGVTNTEAAVRQRARRLKVAGFKHLRSFI